jgi:hypothetical protein
MQSQNPPPSIVDRTISVTRSLRVVANTVMDRAHDFRESGELSLNDFFTLSDRYQTIINQANRACYEAAEQLPKMDEHLAPIESATRELEKASVLLAKVTDVVAVSAQLVQALSGLVVAILKPEPAAFAAVAATIVAAVQGIQGQLSH